MKLDSKRRDSLKKLKMTLILNGLLLKEVFCGTNVTKYRFQFFLTGQEKAAGMTFF